MEETRQKLKEYEENQKIRDEQNRIAEEEARLEKLAGKRHHLLGTSALPGIFTKDHIKKRERVDYICKLDVHNLSMQQRDHLVFPLPSMTENRLAHSKETTEWINSSINEKKGSLRAKEDEDDIPEELAKPVVQGPFLVQFLT